jgi:hypothetical protein
MANLTSIGGIQFVFDPAAIVAIADRDADTGEAVTVVYGLTAGQLRVPESVQGLLNRLGLSQKFAKLTRPNNTSVWMSGQGVKVARQPLAHEYSPPVQSVVSAGDLTQGVTENLGQVRQAVNASGGSL